MCEDWNRVSAVTSPSQSLCEALMKTYGLPVSSVAFQTLSSRKTCCFQDPTLKVSESRSPAIAPDLCQRKMVTGIALGLSHVHYCLYLKRPQGESDACWRSNRERQWEPDLGWVGVGVEVKKGGGDHRESVWENLISDTFLWLQYNTTYNW